MRILVTGSRDWDNEWAVYDALDHAVRGISYYKVTLVHGNCKTGADHFADQWARAREIDAERYPAKWWHYGSAAGPIRNGEMVELGADLCLAFILPCANPICELPKPHTSHGTADCMAKAELKGIPVRRFLG